MLKQFLEHRDAVLAYIRALTGDVAEAEDIFQEVALVIAKEEQRGTQVQRFSPWVREVARRRVAEHFRRESQRNQRRQLHESMADVIDQAFTENESLLSERQHRMMLLDECLALLKGRAKQVIEMRYQQQRNNAQIADLLHWTVESVRVALSRARTTLAECVERRLRLEAES